MRLHQLWMLYGELHCDLASQDCSLKCYYDQNLMSSLLQKRFLFSLSEVAVPVSVIEVNFGAP